MNAKAIRKEAREYFLPFFLGSNRLSHSLSSKLFMRYGIASLILSKHTTPHSILDLSSTRIPLEDSASERLLCDQLIALCSQAEDSLPILVPCTDEYTKAVENNRELLECFFVISSPQELFSSSPISKIPK